MIGDDIKVTVLAVKGNQVRLGQTHRRIFPFTAKRFTSGYKKRKTPAVSLTELRNIREGGYPESCAAE